MSSRCDAVRPQLTVISVRAACTGSCGGRSLGSVCEVDGVNTAEWAAGLFFEVIPSCSCYWPCAIQRCSSYSSRGRQGCTWPLMSFL